MAPPLRLASRTQWGSRCASASGSLCGASHRRNSPVGPAVLATLTTSSTSSVAKDGGEGEKDIFAAAIAAPTEVSTYPAWHSQVRAKLAVGEGPAWLGKNHPFPYNSDFKPPKPVTEEFRQRIMATWEADPKTWTPRQLSLRFRVSVERIRAILKLKLLQRKMEAEGFKVNQEFVAKMESHLGAATPMIPERESEVPDLTIRIPPKLIAIPETAQLSADEAAKILGRRLRAIHQVVEEELSGDTPYYDDQSSGRADDPAPPPIQNDPYERSRWKWCFVDTSDRCAPKERQVLVREPNGDLRQATQRERMAEAKLLWGEKHARYVQ